MKKKYLYLLIFMSFQFAFSQDITDAVRFSRLDMMGTARFSGMAGAFSSLGGDLSSLNINPAGSSIFATNHASGTLNLKFRNNDVNFINGLSSDNDTDFNLNQLGAVFVYTSNDPEQIISKYAYGFTYDQIADYSDSYTARGTNDESIDGFFLNSANGIPLDLLVPLPNESISDLYNFLGESEGVDAQNALLAYQSFVVNPVDPDDLNNNQYVSNINADSFQQNYLINESGYNSKFSFNSSLELKKRFYFGVNLNAHYMEYNRFTSFIESNTSSNSDINRVRFENRLTTRSSAFSFQLGTIAKITDALRASLSYKSPIWYSVTDETTQFISTDSNQSGNATVSPNVINIFPSYNFRTASVWTAGLSYVYKKKGLISLDYSIQDYSNSKFRTNTLQFLNNGLDDNLSMAANLNIGGEYVYKQLRFRGGYFLQESPYDNKDIQSDLEGYSLGLGYVFGNFNIDLAYTMASVERNDILFQTGLSDVANVNSDISNVFLTFSLNF